MSEAGAGTAAAEQLLTVVQKMADDTHPGRRHSVTLTTSFEKDPALDSLARSAGTSTTLSWRTGDGAALTIFVQPVFFDLVVQRRLGHDECFGGACEAAVAAQGIVDQRTFEGFDRLGERRRAVRLRLAEGW